MSPSTATNQQTAGNVFVADAVDRGPRILWDTFTPGGTGTTAGSATSTLYSFFGHTVSANGKNVTNLVQANKVPPPKAHAVQSLGFFFLPNILLYDLITFLANYYFEFKIDNKTFVEGLLSHYPAGGGLSGFASVSTATQAIAAVNNGDATLLAMRRFNDYPRVIPAGPYFGVNVQTPGIAGLQGGGVFTLLASVAATTLGPLYGGLGFRCDLDGLFDDSVQ